MFQERVEIFHRGNVIIAVAILVVLCAIYIPLTAETVQNSDGGEMALSAARLSLIHPPGYPLYMLVAYLVQNLFNANPYNLLSILSAVFVMVGTTILFFTSVFITGERIISAAIALAFGLNSSIMRVATDAEVFGLHILIAILAISLAMLSIFKERVCALIFVASFIFGLGLAHHHTIVLWVPLYLATVFALLRTVYRTIPKTFIVINIALLLLPCALYLTLLDGIVIKRYYAFGPIDNLYELTMYILRTDYGTFSITAGAGTLSTAYAWHFLELTVRESPIILIAGVGILLLAIRDKDIISVGVFISMLFHIWFAGRLNFPVAGLENAEYSSRFYTILILFGYVSLIFVLSKWRGWLTTRYRFIVLLVLSVPTALHINSNIGFADARRDRVIDAELEEILAESDTNSVIFASTDRHAMGLLYKQEIEGKGVDRIPLITAMLSHPNYNRRIKRDFHFLRDLDNSGGISVRDVIISSQRDGRSVYATDWVKLPREFVAVREGVLWKIYKRGQEPSKKDIIHRLLIYCANLPTIKRPPSERTDSLRIYARAFVLPVYALLKSVNNQADRELLADAVKHLQHFKIESARNTCQKIVDSYREIEEKAGPSHKDSTRP